MPIYLERLDPEGYLYYRFAGAVTREDIDRLYLRETSHFESGGYPLGVIVDFNDLDTIAAKLLPQLQRLRVIRSEQVYAVVFVGANPYLRALAISLGVISGQHDFIFRDSLEDAYFILNSYTQRQAACGR
jgi:hypothetical protein